MSIRSYSELSKLKTFEERFEYLKLSGEVCKETFGSDRYLNQVLYKSPEWRAIRDQVIVRDNGCDLGINGHEVYKGGVIIHHMNPVTIDDILQHSDSLFDPEYLITTRLSTHNAIHYGNERTAPVGIVERTMNDTCPWKRD